MLPSHYGSVLLIATQPKWNLYGMAYYIHTLQPNELFMIIVITIITKGISNDILPRVKTLETKVPSSTFQHEIIFTYLKAI